MLTINFCNFIQQCITLLSLSWANNNFIYSRACNSMRPPLLVNNHLQLRQLLHTRILIRMIAFSNTKKNLRSYKCLHQLARSSKLLTAMNPDRESQPLHSGNHLQPAWKVLEPSHCQQNGMTKYETTKWDKQTHQKNIKSHKKK